MKADVLNQLESQITENKKALELEVALDRLASNPDFIRIIEQGYLRDKAVQLVSFRGSPSCIGAIAEDTDRDIIGISKLRQYLGSIRRDARLAETVIEQCREAVVEIENESEEQE